MTKSEGIRKAKKYCRDWGEIKPESDSHQNGKDPEGCDFCHSLTITATWHGVTQKGYDVFACDTCYRLVYDPVADLIRQVDDEQKGQKAEVAREPDEVSARDDD